MLGPLVAVGYTDRLIESVPFTVSADGSVKIPVGPVLVGDLWTVSLFAVRNITSDCVVELVVFVDPLVVPLSSRDFAGRGLLVFSRVSPLVLKAGDVLRAVFEECKAGDKLEVFVLGVRTKL